MVEGKRELFRKEAIERMSSPDGLDELIRIVAPKDWLFLGALLLMMAVFAAWCLWGQLPTTVTGQGVITRPRKVVEIQSSAPGRLVDFKIRVGDEIRRGDILGTVDQEEIKNQLQADLLRREELRNQDKQKLLLQDQQAELQARDIKAQRRYLAIQSLNREQSIRNAELLVPVLKKRMDSRRQMIADGLLPRISDELLQAEKEYLDNQAKISDLHAQLRDIENQLEQLETKEKEQARQLLEATTSRRNELLTLDKNIALYEVQLKKNSMVISECSGRILEISAYSGEVLSAGMKLASIELNELSRDEVCVTYFPIRDGKRVRPGMTVQVTPETVKRERYGGILGVISSVSAFPVTKEGVALSVGNPEVAQRLLKDEPQIEVVAELEHDQSTVSRYRWSSSKGPPMQITAGTPISARVLVEERAPITYLLPFLRSVSGIY